METTTFVHHPALRRRRENIPPGSLHSKQTTKPRARFSIRTKISYLITGQTFPRPVRYSQTNSYIAGPNKSQCSPSCRKQTHSVTFGVGRRMNMRTDSCITAFVTRSIPTVNGFLDCSPHALSPSFSLCESPLLSPRHVPTKFSLFPCDFGSPVRKNVETERGLHAHDMGLADNNLTL